MARVFFIGFLLSAAVIAALSSPFPQEGGETPTEATTSGATATTAASSGGNNNNNNNFNNQMSGINCTQLQEQCAANNNQFQNGASQGQSQLTNQTNGQQAQAPITIQQNNNVTNPCNPQAMQFCQMNQMNQINQSPIMINQTNFNMVTAPPAQFNPNQFNQSFNPAQMQTIQPIVLGR